MSQFLTTVAELKQFVALDTKGIPPGIARALDEVERQVIEPLLGAPLATWLQGQYAAAGFDAAALTPAAQLLRAVQAPLAQLGVAQGLPAHQVTLDETGVHIMTTETSKTAFQWQVNQLQAGLTAQGYQALDRLVQWLEDHREATPELTAWATSEAGQRHRRELFTRTTDFHEYENIGASRATFLALRPVRRRQESFALATVLGDEFLAELRAKTLTRALDATEQNLLSAYVYPALAALSIGHGIPELGLKLAGDGVALTVARFDDAGNQEVDAGLDRLLQNKVDEALLSGARYLRQLRDYLDRTASATRWATYFNSPAYTAPNQPVTPLNSSDTRIFKFC